MNMHTPYSRPAWLLDRIRSCLRYAPETGDLIWAHPLANRNKVGDIAGSINDRGYRQISFFCAATQKTITLKCSHICWFLFYGSWPEFPIDHKDTNKKNNCIHNLRLSTSAGNACNVGLRRDNTSGMKGIYFNTKEEKYRVQLNINGKRTTIGRYVRLADAVNARNAAYTRYHGDFVRV